MKRLTADWVKKSEGDLFTAEREFVASPPNYDAAAYHAQQAAEKFLKACLIESDVRFPKTHDLPALLDDISLEEQFTGALDAAYLAEEQGRLPASGTVLRLTEGKA